MLEKVMQEALWVVLAPLMGSLIAGLGGSWIGRRGAHRVAILGVALAFGLSLDLAFAVFNHHLFIDQTLYQWAAIGGLVLQVGFWIDPLTVWMMVIVTSVSLMVHIYTIGYMADDPGYQRFFSYISLFTFAMLMLVMANNFLQLFFGWEAVGLVSYLLIGFWFQRESAVVANLKAFLVNRVGDLGFLLGIAAICGAFHSLNYADVFTGVQAWVAQGDTFNSLGFSGSLVTFVCVALFIGAMGKSAQIPLHVWLPDSMEGPTPISALIHAATMVTAGIFMISRMSPLFEHSETALNLVLCVGASTAFFMGLLGLVQNDIKRVIAYSTLSQLGYMMAALGASAYGAGLFHLMTHAFFKALLFLGAGAVIMALHHEQDIRRMGGLALRLPIVYTVMLLGSLALIGFPGFSGFYSKDLIIEAVGLSQLPGSGYAYALLLASVFVTALYSFRLFFLVFHGKPRMSPEALTHVHEGPLVIWGPLILLAIPSVMAGALWIGPLLEHALGSALVVLPAHDVLGALAEHYEGPWHTAWQGLRGRPFALAMMGALVAYLGYCRWPRTPEWVERRFRWIVLLLQAHYGFDWLYLRAIVPVVRGLGALFWRWGDQQVIDGVCVNGSARRVAGLGSVLGKIQTGYLYHYAFAMVLGLLAALIWLWWPFVQ